MTKHTYTIIANQSSRTEEFGEMLGSHLIGGECIELISDVGGGKTTFVRGLARGAGSLDNVSSPTFTIAQRYSSPRLTIYHYDFYRLAEAGLVADELAEGLDNPKVVTVVEWAESVKHVLPEKRIQITFHKVADDAESRRIEIMLPDSYTHLKGLKL